jgi:hypothetical protein
MVAGINRTPVSALVIAFVLALVTVSDVAGESLLHEMFKASGIIGELAVKIHDRIPQVFRDWLVAVHSFHLQFKWLVFYMLNGKWGGCPVLNSKLCSNVGNRRRWLCVRGAIQIIVKCCRWRRARLKPGERLAGAALQEGRSALRK